jgi:LytS/YehU family sensor histidine kinase
MVNQITFFKSYPAEKQMFIENKLIKMIQELGPSFKNFAGSIENELIAPLLLIPFLENSFKHSVNTSFDTIRYVHITLNVNNHLLNFSIANNKSSAVYNTENLPLVGGIGLENVNRRLQLIYPNRFELNILNLPQEYCVNLSLKLND